MQQHFESPRPKTKDQRPKPSDVAAILLAAGRSRRMGAFKPLLPFGDKTIIESCVDYLQRGGVETIVVVLGHRAAEIRAKLEHLHSDKSDQRPCEVRFALNPNPGSEMSESIACGVCELLPDCRATLIALTDQPAIPQEVVASLITEWSTTGAKLLIPEFEGRGGHPVLVDLQYRDQLLRLDPERGLRGLFDAHRERVRRFAVGSPYIARDLDTWNDYHALHQEMFGAAPPNL